MGSGIGSLDDVYETTVAYEKGVRTFIPSKARIGLTWKRAIEKYRHSSFRVSSSTSLQAMCRCDMGSRYLDMFLPITYDESF